MADKKLLSEGKVAQAPLKREGTDVANLAKRIDWCENQISLLSRKLNDFIAEKKS